MWLCFRPLFLCFSLSCLTELPPRPPHSTVIVQPLTQPQENVMGQTVSPASSHVEALTAVSLTMRLYLEIKEVLELK